MSAEGDRSTLDGNAAGGLLREVFAFDARVAPTTCAGCGRTRPMAELMLYAVELGAILRCPSCDQAVVRIGRTPRGLWLDLRGATTVVAADPATHPLSRTAGPAYGTYLFPWVAVERVGDAAHACAGLNLEGLRRDLDRALDHLNQSGWTGAGQPDHHAARS